MVRRPVLMSKNKLLYMIDVRWWSRTWWWLCYNSKQPKLANNNNNNIITIFPSVSYIYILWKITTNNNNNNHRIYLSDVLQAKSDEYIIYYSINIYVYYIVFINFYVCLSIVCKAPLIIYYLSILCQIIPFIIASFGRNKKI